MARGYTGRFNSGVIIAQKHITTIQWLDEILLARKTDIPLEDSVGWGENGHIIHFSKQKSFVQTLPTEWNNTYKVNAKTYIQHENFGPLRKSKWLSSAHKCLSLITRLVQRCQHQVNRLGLTENQTDPIEKLFNQVMGRYAEYFTADQATPEIEPLTPKASV